MTEIRFGWRGARARVLAAGLTIALAPLPLAAAEADSPAPVITLKTAIAKAAATERLASYGRARANGAARRCGRPESRRLQDPARRQVIAVVGAERPMPCIRAQNDRIHSAAR